MSDKHYNRGDGKENYLADAMKRFLKLLVSVPIMKKSYVWGSEYSSWEALFGYFRLGLAAKDEFQKYE